MQRSWDRSVGIATGYGMDGPSSISGEQGLLLSIDSKPTLGYIQPPMLRVAGVPSLRLKRQRREADHSNLSSAEVKKGGVIPQRPNMSLWHSA
jgi:hypothetical protein